MVSLKQSHITKMSHITYTVTGVAIKNGKLSVIDGRIPLTEENISTLAQKEFDACCRKGISPNEAIKCADALKENLDLIANHKSEDEKPSQMFWSYD